GWEEVNPRCQTSTQRTSHLTNSQTPTPSAQPPVPPPPGPPPAPAPPPPTPDPKPPGIKLAVRAISAYTLPPYRAAIKLNQNENPFDMPGEIKQEVSRRLANRAWSRYPDFVPTSLLERLAAFAGWKPEGTLAGNGSNELIQATLMVTVGAGTR